MTAMQALALLAITCAAGCRGSNHEQAAPAPSRAQAPLSRDASAPVIDAPPPDAAPTPGTSDVTLTVDGKPFVMRWGFAAYFEGGARIELFGGPVDCSMRMSRTSSLSEASLHLFVPSGPGGHYYTGHAIGVDATVLSPTTLRIPAYAAIATLEPTTWKEGARVRGTIDGHFVMLVGTAAVTGRFDVEICDDLTDNAESKVAETAPATRARGAIGKESLAPRTVLALVQRAPATPEEATDVAIGRARGTRRNLSIGFFNESNVACPAGDAWDPAHLPVLYLQDPAGAGEEHPLVGTQQPAQAVFPKGEMDFRAVWRGWVRFDNLAFERGAKVRGTVWQEAPSFEDAKGTFGGRFEATVCDATR